VRSRLETKVDFGEAVGRRMTTVECARTRAGIKKALGIFRAQKEALRKKGLTYVTCNQSISIIQADWLISEPGNILCKITKLKDLSFQREYMTYIF
jgi:hypothetical protein